MHISTSFIGTKNLETQLTLIDILYEENQGIKIELSKTNFLGVSMSQVWSVFVPLVTQPDSFKRRNHETDADYHHSGR